MSPPNETSSNSDNSNDRPMGSPQSEVQQKGRSSLRQSVSGFTGSPGVKFFLTGFITLALLIPTMMVWGLVEERSQRADEVARSIAQGWGGAQTINGPYLVVPYSILEKVDRQFKQVTRHAIISASQLSIKGDIDVEERQKSIYKTQLYHLRSTMTGNFDPVNLEKIREIGGNPKPAQAFVAMGISDMTGIRSNIAITLRGIGNRDFQPGLKGLHGGTASSVERPRSVYKNSRYRQSGGVHLPVSEGELKSGFAFDLSFALNGSKGIEIVPSGSSTDLALKSNWPHPGFAGDFLPEKRDVTDEGFDANWTVPSLARGIDTITFKNGLPSASSPMKVTFVEPLDFYQVTARTLKYAVGFFSLIFLAVFVLELSGKRVVHWIQYTLVGLAMVIFYVMLLAFAEQVGFAVAYAISSIATTVLISWYVGDALGQKYGTVIMASILGTTYAIMYMILNQEEFALLAGSLVAFGAIAATMAMTRKVDWSNRSGNTVSAI